MPVREVLEAFRKERVQERASEDERAGNLD